MDALLVTEISQATAIQRAGRAGRTGPGKVYRLYKEESFEAMRVNSVPEIQRSSLISTVLGLKKRGIVDVLHFPFLDPPDATLVKTALKHLYLLGAIDEVGQLTSLGDQMSAFPLAPSLSRVLLASCTFGCSYEVVTIASLLAGEMDLFKTPSLRGRGGAHITKEDMDKAMMEAEECKLRFAHHSGDHLTYLNVWNEWRRYRKDKMKQKQWCQDNYIHGKVLETALRVRDQLMDVMKKLNLPIVHAPRIQSSKQGKRQQDENESIDAIPILKSFLTGYFSNVANKGAHRHVFSHYSPDKHFLMDGGIASMEHQLDDHHTTGSLVALYLHPLCSFSDMLDRHKIRYRELDWVMYMHVTYTNKAVMKGVSKIIWDWVKESEGLKRLDRLPKTRLNGEDRPDVEEMEQEQIELVDHEAIQIQQEQALLDKQKRRAEEIEQIRQRALSRRRLQ
ncbi:P-loop containing nucleoside triphosphate hydrolase protein [Halteromyces radiatus]|uniref:P-loop containing nucleoside triphosphate hydrolase protein n=1 Tax=Halteromyces radiatus TaxID=101107 RepID=UPI002220C118|nr:P-loop containing nucleoside triphosphate hydrolase protein [Halteromyces radiatus]KAI8096649.1 P-loop containing nucleoside triphosphate hydrolase protein [Halteromyces radiatus]